MRCARLIASPLAARMSASRRSRNTISRSMRTTVTFVQGSECKGRRPSRFGAVADWVDDAGPVGSRVAVNPESALWDDIGFTACRINLAPLESA
jgi:hypothetical protein